MLSEVWAAAQQVQVVSAWTARCDDTSDVHLQAIGDLDGDGVSEVAVSYTVTTLKSPPEPRSWVETNPPMTFGEWDQRGVVRILSGRTGRTWKQFVDCECGMKNAHSFGRSAEVLRGKDGGPWLVIGQPWTGPLHGQVTCLDPATGQAKFVIEGEGRLDQFGWEVVVIHDLDGDGQDDLAVAAAGTTGTEGQHESDCYISLRSGKTGAEIRRLSPDPSGNRPLLFRADDVTGDGVAELGVVLTQWGSLDEGRPDRPRLLLLDLPHDSVIWDVTIAGSREDGASNSAWSVSCNVDCDGDGKRDILLGVPWPDLVQDGKWVDTGGVVYALSAASGKELRAYGKGQERDDFGVHVAALGDMNGDGLNELAVTRSAGSRADDATVVIVDGRTGKELVEPGGVGRVVSLAGMGDVHSSNGVSSLAVARSVRENNASHVDIELLSLSLK